MSESNGRREDRPAGNREGPVKRKRSTTVLVDEASPSVRRRHVDRVERDASFDSTSNVSTVLSPAARRTQKGKGRARAKEAIPPPDARLGKRPASFRDDDDDDDEDTATAFRSVSKRRVVEGGQSSGGSTPSSSEGIAAHPITQEGPFPVRIDISERSDAVRMSAGTVKVRRRLRRTTEGGHDQEGNTTLVPAVTLARQEEQSSQQPSHMGVAQTSNVGVAQASRVGVAQTSQAADPISSHLGVPSIQTSDPGVSSAHTPDVPRTSRDARPVGPPGHTSSTGVLLLPGEPVEHSSHVGALRAAEQPPRTEVIVSQPGAPSVDQASNHSIASLVQPASSSGVQTAAPLAQRDAPPTSANGPTSSRLRPGRQCARGRPPSEPRAQRQCARGLPPSYRLNSHHSHTTGLPSSMDSSPPPPPPPPPPPSGDSQLHISSYMFPPPHSHPMLWVNTIVPPHAMYYTHAHHSHPAQGPGQHHGHPAQSPGQHHGHPAQSPGQHHSHPAQGPGQHHGHPAQSPGQHHSHPAQGPGQHHGHPAQSPGQHHSHPAQGPGQHHGHPAQSPGQHHSHPAQGPGQHHGHPAQSPGQHHGHPFQMPPSSVVHWVNRPNPQTGQRDTTALIGQPRRADPLQQPGNPVLWGEVEEAATSGEIPLRSGGRGHEQEVPRWGGVGEQGPPSGDPPSEGYRMMPWNLDPPGGTTTVPPPPERWLQEGRRGEVRGYQAEENHLPYLPLLRVVSADPSQPRQERYIHAGRLNLPSFRPHPSDRHDGPRPSDRHDGPRPPDRHDGPRLPDRHDTSRARHDGPSLPEGPASPSGPGPSTASPSDPGPSTASPSGPGPSTASPSGPGPSNAEVIIVDDDSSDEEVLTPRRRRRARRRQQRRRGNTHHLTVLPPRYEADEEDHLIRDNYSALATRVSQWTHDDARRFLHAASNATATRPRNRDEWMNAVGSMAPEVLYRVIIGPYVSIPAGVLSGGGSYEELIELAERLGPGGPQGIAQEVIDRLPVRAYTRDPRDKASRCVVCMNDFENEDRVRSLPCTHEFHQPCIDQWFENHRSCPLCRGEVVLAQ